MSVPVRAAVILNLESNELSSVTALLEGCGYGVAIADGTGSAVRDMEATPPDLIVSGLAAPDLEGWSLCRLVRSAKNRVLRRTPVLLVSSLKPSAEAERITRDAGGNLLLRLPVEPNAFQAAVLQLGAENGVGETTPELPREYRALFAGMMDAYALHEMIFDAAGRAVDYRFLEANPAFEEITGLGVASIRGKTVMEVLPSTEQHWIDAYARVLSTGEACRFESHHAGLCKYFDVVAFRVDEDRFACIFRDITAQKESKREVLRLNRLYAVLSQVNQAIARAESKEDLFQRVCRLAVEFGQFRAVWLGSVDPVTSEIKLAVEDRDELGGRIRIDDSRCGAARKAAATGRPVICGPGLEARCECGDGCKEISSCAAFPIQCAGRVAAVLALYTEEENFFSSAEIGLLEEVSFDISFALDKFEAAEGRKRAEDALHHEQEFIRTVLDHIGEGVLACDAGGQMALFNRVARDWHGMSDSDFRAGEWPGLSELYTFDGREKLAMEAIPLARALSGELLHNAGMSVVRPGCETRFLLVSGGPILDRIGRQTGAVVAARDITEIKRAEDALRAKTEELENYFDLTVDMLCIASTEGRLLSVTGAWKKVLGYTPAEMVNRFIPDFVHPEDRAETLAVLQRSREERIEDFSNRYIAKDGSYRWIEWRSRPAGEHIYAVARDVTDRRAMEEARRESEERFSKIFQHAPAMMSITDLATGVFVDVNEKAETILGYCKEELLGKNGIQANVFSAGDRARLVAALQAGGRVSGMDLTVRAKDGRLLPCVYDGALLTLGSRVCVLTALMDMSEHRRYESEREAMVKLLGILNAPSDLTELVGDVARCLQDWSGCDAVGIRLSEGDDFPYYQTRGFSQEFVKAQSKLSVAGPTGELLRDGGGTAELACLCGATLQGRACGEPAHFTSHGSFWTNNASEMVACMAENELPRHYRGRCLHEGYETIALVPLRLGGRNIGLLQLNSFEEKRLTPEAIGFLERASNSIATAVEQRRAQAALRVSEEKFRAIADYTPGLDMWFSPEGKLLWVNPGVKNLTGYSVEECHAMTGFPVCLVSGEDRPREFDALQHAMTGGRADELESRIVCRDGSNKWVSVSYQPIFDSQGRPLGTRASVRDISSRKQSEIELRRSRHWVERILDATPDVVYIIDLAERRCAYLNRPGLDALGLTTRDGGRMLIGRVHPDDQERLEKHFERCATAHDHEVLEIEYRIAHVDGSWRWFHSRDVAFARNAEGRVVEVLGAATDFTDRQRTESEKAALADQLRQAQKLESVGRLAGGIAHDFNNLLTVINGYSDLLMAELNDQDPLHSSASEIRSAGARAAGLTQQLLAFSRKQVVAPKPLMLNRLVKEMRDMLQRLLGEDIQMAIKLAPELGWVLADHGQLHQVLMNLVVNARDAMPTGGRITIETANRFVSDSDAPVHAGAAPGPYVELAVRDTGIGMDAEVRARIFEPFFTTKREGAGTGLGLSTVYGIVKQCNGSIRVESEPGRGSTFSVLLPLGEEPETADDLSQTPATGLRGNETVLVVEDQAEVRKLAVAILRSYGYRVVQARDGAEALMLAEHHSGPIHLVLTDVVMPLMNGKEMAMRMELLRPGIRVLYMSGYTDDVIAHHGVLEPGLEYLPKPFSPQALARRVRSLLGTPRPAARILVVDDEQSVRSLFSKVLARQGYEVMQAHDGDQALEMIRTTDFDMVITDLVMPNREGIETIKELRAQRPGVKIIAVSGAFEGSFLKVAEKLGAEATLRKPVSPNQLLLTVQQVLG